MCDSGSSTNNINLSLASAGDIVMMTNDTGGGQYGSWCHSGTWHGSNDWVIESDTGSGVHLGNGIDYRNADQSVVLRATSGSVNGSVVRDWAVSQIGDPYNYNFCDKGNRGAFYCSHLGWASFMDTHGIGMDSSPNTEPCDTVFPKIFKKVF